MGLRQKQIKFQGHYCNHRFLVPNIGFILNKEFVKPILRHYSSISLKEVRKIFGHYNHIGLNVLTLLLLLCLRYRVAYIVFVL